MSLEVAHKNAAKPPLPSLREPALTITDAGLALGRTVPAKLGRNAGGMPQLAIDGAEERIFALLATVYGKAARLAVLGNIRRASTYWSQGESILAAIELALGGLPPLDDPDAASLRLSLGEKLLAAGVTPRELIIACGLDPAALDTLKAGFNPNELRIPAGNGRGSGDWTTAGNSTTLDPSEPVRSLLGPVKYAPVDGPAPPAVESAGSTLTPQLSFAVQAKGVHFNRPPPIS